MTKPKKPNDKLERGGYVNFEPPKEWEKHQKVLKKFKASIEARAARLVTPELREAEENFKRLADSVKQHSEGLEALNLEFNNLISVIKSNPNSDGWIRLCEILKEAKEDKRVMSSKGASEFTELMWLLAMDALTASSADQALDPLTDSFKSSISRDMVNKRFQGRNKAREWVVREWMQHKSGYPSKADFARIYAKRVLNEFGEKCDDRTIKERWLRGI